MWARMTEPHAHRWRTRAPGWAGALCAAVAVGRAGHDLISPLPPLTPADVVGAYALRTVDGHPLPVVFGAPGTLIYHSLTFAADSTFLDQSGTGLEGSPAVVDAETYAGRWTLDAGSRTVHTMTTQTDATPGTVINFSVGATVDTLRVVAKSGGFWVYTRAGR